MTKNTPINLSPSHIILFSFFVLIILGTTLLSLPLSRFSHIPLIDLFFTATSATCVTGLFTIPLSNFTMFGKTVIMMLIQCGALGLASMSLLIISLFIDLGISTKFMAGQLLELDSWHTIKKVLKFTFVSTLLLESLGALCFFLIFYNDYTLPHAIFYSIFHSISSFCNAGISFFHFFTEQNLGIYKTNYLFLITTSLLTFFGGLGFITWHEIILRMKTYFYSLKPHRFSLHSKIILYSTIALLLITTILFFLLEKETIKSLPFLTQIAYAVFHAVSFKSCGFILEDITDFNLATIFLIMIIAFIGSSPGSTGSGIKITNFTLFLNTLKATINGRLVVEIFEREIPLDQIYKAIAIISLSTCWVLTTTFCLLITENNWSFFEIFFETVSGFSNLGFSLKGTQHLSLIGKLLICATMLIGRIGSLTFILGLKLRKKTDTTDFSYPEERVMLG
jgi:trk system potassium uptake protein TrkH